MNDLAHASFCGCLMAECLPTGFLVAPARIMWRRSLSQAAPLLQLGVFRLGLLEDRNVGISVFPASKEVLVGRSSFSGIAGESIGAGETNPRKCIERICRRYPPALQNPLILGRGVLSIPSLQVSLGTSVVSPITA